MQFKTNSFGKVSKNSPIQSDGIHDRWVDFAKFGPNAIQGHVKSYVVPAFVTTFTTWKFSTHDFSI
jgi:hypothetical protein